jgi:hypothetical protein
MNRVEEKTIKSGNGTMLSAGFEVINGEEKGRLVFHNFITQHTNPKASEIGLEQLGKYLNAVGVDGGFEELGYDNGALQNYTELPFTATVKIQEGTNGYSDSNKITSFKAR